MRGIKYRGKNHAGEWVYGSLVESENMEPAIYFQVGEGKVKHRDYRYVKPNTIGQFSGCYDKNGKEIYEGDIVFAQLLSGGRVKCNIKFFSYDRIFLEYEDIREPLCGMNTKLLEVIGNIHDNKML